MPGRLFNRDFLLLSLGQLVSQVGSQLFTIAAYLWLMDETGSVALVGLLAAASTLPRLVVGPIASAVADRFSRRNLLVISDAARGVAMVALGALALFFPDRPEIVQAALFGAVIVSSIAAAFFDPSVAAAVPDLVPEERLASANSVYMSLGRAARLIGPSLGGVAYTVLGAPWLFLLDGASYLVSALSEMFLRLPPSQAAERTAGLFATLRAETSEGFRYVWDQAGLRRVVFVVAAVNFMVATTPILMPFYVEIALAESKAWYGLTLSVMSAGTLSGLIAAGAWKVEARGRARLLVAAPLGTAIGYAGLALWVDRFAVFAYVFVIGFFVAVFNVHMTTLLQLRTPAEIRGRVFGILGTLVGATMPLATVLAGVVADANGKNIPPLFLVCAFGVFLPTLLAALDTTYRRFLTEGEPEG